MRRALIVAFITFLLSGALIFNYASAALDFGQGDKGLLKGVAEGSGYKEAGREAVPLSASVGRIASIALSLVGMIFFALAVYAGILWMTASGNDEQVTKATNILKAATVGLIISLGAYSLSAFITKRALSITKSPVPAAVAGAVPREKCWDGITGSIDSFTDYIAAGINYAADNTNCGYGLICEGADWDDLDPCP